MYEWDSKIQFLTGVGPKRASLLQKELEVETISDLLHLYPFRYIDRSRYTLIADAGVGSQSLLQGIFPTQGSNPGLLHCRQILWSHQRSPSFFFN